VKENASRADRPWCGILLVLATATLLSGCATPAHAPTHPSKSGAAPSASAKPTSGPTTPTTQTPPPPSATATPVVGATPVNIACNTVLTPNQVYAYNPNYVDDSAYAPAPSSPEATVKASQGTLCGWVNETSSETFGVAIGKPAASALASAKTAAARGAPVAGYSASSGVAAYFSTAGGIGRVQAFKGPYWVVVSSTTFGQAQDATPVLQAVLKNLPAS
jgi:hypothetical protein